MQGSFYEKANAFPAIRRPFCGKSESGAILRAWLYARNLLRRIGPGVSSVIVLL
ncbi:hypothetical protein [Pedomonas mirosovicensis]|uniref:hypothetical protein n=1 Tax=Pedomonas mirosovicensis TaxID=2908641 RepID=UPI002167878C|nr:hypothetical protein [Pedomonas mirosovicensis]MCH8685010.1 hypothetical protein [Pedomonas mirosovicensis]